MILNLQIYEKFDVFYFSEKEQSGHIKFNHEIYEIDLIDYLFSSLSRLKCVYFVSDIKVVPSLKLSVDQSKHSVIKKNEYIYLNISIRNHLKKIIISQKKINNFQDLEQFFIGKIQNLI